MPAVTRLCLAVVWVWSLFATVPMSVARAEDAATVDASTLRRKLMCGYQGWFRCPGDAFNRGWIHWSRHGQRLAPDTLTFEMWPDMTEYTAAERFAVPGFTHPSGAQAELFSTDNAATVRRHFEWMKQYGIDGVYLQHFVVDLPGGPNEARYPSRRRVIDHLRAAALATGRVWALAYDMAALPEDKVFDLLTRDWKRMVDERVTADPRYLHERGRPVVQIWGFYYQNSSNHMSPALGNRLIDFFRVEGPYAAYLVGGGSWDWRRIQDPEWRQMFDRFEAYMPWNVGNYSRDQQGVKHASTATWAEDRRQFQTRGATWIPVVYPGFSWDNLQQKPAGTTNIARRQGEFLWEQFYELARLGEDSAYVAMFDEVDEGTAIFKVTSSPPTQAHFVGYEGLPSDWYLRLVGEGGRMIRGQRPASRTIPIEP